MTSPQTEEIVIDTSRMNVGQRDAMEVAEAAREGAWRHPSFARQLFMGSFRCGMLLPFPVQNHEDRKIGDEYVADLANYLSRHLDPDRVDETRTIPQEVMDELARRGVFAMKIPGEYGGLGLSQVNYNRTMMMISSYCGSTAVLVSAHQSIGVPQPLMLFGTAAQKKKYLPRFREGAISAFALTELEVGSDPAKMSTTATPFDDGRYYLLNGQKLWCTNGVIADVMVVMAQTPPKIVNGRERKQITAFIVETDSPGFEVLHRCDFMGLRGIQNGLLRFKDLRVPSENILWGEGLGLKLALTTLNTGRLTLPAACTGMAKQCLAIARRWGKERVQWGLPVGQHEAGSSKVATIAATTFAMEAVTLLTSHWADRGDIDIRIEAAMAKLFCSEMAWRVADLTMQLRGGRGYERATSLRERGEVPYPVERMMRECRINRIIEGTSEIMRLILAREAMDPHLKVVADLLKHETSVGRKIRASLKMAAFYSTWYPAQWINTSLLSTYGDVGDLGKHLHFVDIQAHRLARTIFHSMAFYRDKLERKQNLLGRLMDIGTELFAMAATCSYARQQQQEKNGDATPARLADLFCSQARLRVSELTKSLSRNEDAKEGLLAHSVLDGDMRWLEKDIVKLGPPE